MRKLNFVIDIGNTSIGIGVFKDNDLLYKYSSFAVKFEKKAFKNGIISFFENNNILINEISDGIISSVVPSLTKPVQDCIKEVTGKTLPIFKISDNKIIELNVDEPDSVGADLVADVVASKTLYGYPSLVVDFGTITKLLVITEEGKFEYASFFPGLSLCLKTMSSSTALIPEFKGIKRPSDVFGKNTEEAMRSGIFYGTSSLVNHSIKYFREKYGENAKVILCGGNSELLTNDINDHILDTDLCLKGLNIIIQGKKR